MTKNILAQVALLSMVVCSVTQLAFSQQPAADDLFGSGDPFDLPSSPVAPGSGGYPIGESSTQSNARASKEFTTAITFQPS